MENKIISILLTDKDSKYLGKIQEGYFLSDKCKKQFKFIQDFSNNYGFLPSLEVMKEEFEGANFEVIAEEEEDFFINKFISKYQKIAYREVLEKAINDINNSLNTETDINVLVDKAIEPIENFRLLNCIDKDGTDWGKSALKRLEIYKDKANNPEAEGIKTGIGELDGHIRGLQKGDLDVISGFTGTGKTWFLCYLILKSYLEGKSVLFYSLEMPVWEVANRLDTFAFNVSNIHMSGGKLDENSYQRYEEGLTKLSEIQGDAPNFIHIIEGKDLGEEKLSVNRVNADIKKFKPDIVFIDQLSKMKMPPIELRLAYGAVTNNLKNLAIAQDIPIVLAVQTNRTGFKEKDVDTTSIAESNAITENADKVLILKRPPKEEGVPDLLKMMNIYVAKVRGSFPVNEPVTVIWDVNMGKISSVNDRLGSI